MKRLICAAASPRSSMPVAAQDKGRRGHGAGADRRWAATSSRSSRRSASKVRSRARWGSGRCKGTLALTLQLPDHMHRSEDTEMMGGMSIERTSVLAGDTSWEDMQNRGGMGGGMQIVMRQGPPGQELNPEQIEAGAPAPLAHRVQSLPARVPRRRHAAADVRGRRRSARRQGRRARSQERGRAGRAHLHRSADAHAADAAVPGSAAAHQHDGRARRSVAGPARARRARWPGMRRRRPPPPALAGAGRRCPADGQRPNPEEMRRRMESMPPPAPSTVTLYLGDYKKVDGVMLPHRLTQAVDGKTGRGVDHREGQGQPVGQGRSLREEVAP